MAGDFQKNHMDVRADQRPKVERLQALAKRTNSLKIKGRISEARALDPEIKKLKRELGIKPKVNKLTPVQREQKKNQLKARLKKICK